MRTMYIPIIILLIFSCQKTDVNHLTTGVQVTIGDDERFGYGFEDARRKPKPPHPTHPHAPTPVPPVEGDLVVYLSDKGYYNNEIYWGQVYLAPPVKPLDMPGIKAIMESNYAGYKVSFTTDSTVFLAATPTHRTRVVFTSTVTQPGLSGITIIGSYSWGENAPPSIVYSDVLGGSTSHNGEIGSHELGHAIGMRHDYEWTAECTFLSWKPQRIMGNPLTGGDSQWSPGHPCRFQLGQNNISDHEVLSQTVGVR